MNSDWNEVDETSQQFDSETSDARRKQLSVMCNEEDVSMSVIAKRLDGSGCHLVQR